MMSLPEGDCRRWRLLPVWRAPSELRGAPRPSLAEQPRPPTRPAGLGAWGCPGPSFCWFRPGRLQRPECLALHAERKAESGRQRHTVPKRRRLCGRRDQARARPENMLAWAREGHVLEVTLPSPLSPWVS